MTITKPIVFLDLETTGTDPVADRIVEFSFVVMDPGSDAECTCDDDDFNCSHRFVGDIAAGGVNTSKRWTRRVNPGMPIPAEATAIHGITDEDVKGCPTFEYFAPKITASLKGKDIAGYNLWRFDLIVLDESLRRIGLKLDLSESRVIDCYQAFAKKHPRDLKAFVKQFAGRDHEGAHGAEADATGTADGFLGLFRQHEDLAAMSMEELAKFTRNGDHEYADLAGKLYFDAEGKVRYGFGKNEGACVLSNRSYAEWILKSDFPASTKEVLRGLLGRTV